MVIRTIVHFEIPADNVAKLSRFYQETFGWKFEKVPMGEFDYWIITTGPRGKSVGGGMYKKTGPDETPRNFIQVEKIDTAIAVFKKAGGREVAEKQEVPGIGFTFLGADPEGNVVGLYEPKGPPIRRARAKET